MKKRTAYLRADRAGLILLAIIIFFITMMAVFLVRTNTIIGDLEEVHKQELVRLEVHSQTEAAILKEEIRKLEKRLTGFEAKLNDFLLLMGGGEIE